MIIVEGPDGAGKTTLVHELAKQLQLTVAERVKDRDQLYTTTRQDTFNGIGESVTGYLPVKLYDRLFYSELVYAPIMERELAFNDEEITHIRRCLVALACPIIVCLPPYEDVVKNVYATPQMDGVAENVEYIYNKYREIVGEAHPNIMYYDYTHTLTLPGYRPYNDVVRACELYLDRRKQRTWH